MSKPDYLYVTYIRTTPEKVWRALVDTDVTGRYWGDPARFVPRVNVSDWKPGSRWEHRRNDAGGTVDIAGTVVEVDPPRHLVITWSRPDEIDDESLRSRVTFDIEALNEGMVKLTVTHDDVARDERMFKGISGGWPMVLSNLKTLLETGRPIQG
jgi:uncharacterized protein YndB with AHSA1/START domain